MRFKIGDKVISKIDIRTPDFCIKGQRLTVIDTISKFFTLSVDLYRLENDNNMKFWLNEREINDV